MEQRQYINSTDVAITAVELIRQLATSPQFTPIISIDTETAPIAGLEGYPGTTFDDDEDPEKPSKKMYLAYGQLKWAESFNPYALADLGLRVPRKLTAGNETKGVRAGEAWKAFLGQLQTVTDEQLEGCRWSAREADFYQEMQQNELDKLEMTLEGLKSFKKGKKAAIEATEREIEHQKWLIDRVVGIKERVAEPLDVRILRHIITIPVEGRFKVDPLRPGLDPFTSDIFLLQISLQRIADGVIFSWIFNVFDVPLSVLAPLLTIKRRTYLGANIKFDLKMFIKHFGFAPRDVACTRIASRMLYLGLRMSHSLAACAERFINVTMSKETRNSFVGVRPTKVTPAQLEYAFLDTEILFPIYAEQMRLAEERGQTDLISTFGKLSYITAYWEINGLNIDAVEWMRLADEIVKQRDDIAAQVEDILLPGYRAQLAAAQVTISGENAADPDAEAPENSEDSDEDSVVDTRREVILRLSRRELVAEKLSELLGIPVPSLGKDARNALEGDYIAANGITHPFFYLYSKWAKLEKQASTYGKRFLSYVHPLTGRIHPNYNIAGTDTGRYSGSKPNPLNIPTMKGEDDFDFRAAFLARPGYKFANADYSAMEQRIAADLTGDETLIALFENDGDSHSVTAAYSFHLVFEAGLKTPYPSVGKFVYGIKTLEVTTLIVPAEWQAADLLPFIIKDRSFFSYVDKDTGETVPASLVELIENVYKKTTRGTAKTVGFLVYFRGSAFGMAKKNNLPLAQCEDFFERFGETYPTLMKGFDEMAEEPFKNFIMGNDGWRYGFASSYNGLRRYFRLPHSPDRSEYENGWNGNRLYNDAAWQFKRACGKIRREAANVGTQGGNAVIIAEALLLLEELGRPYGIFPALAMYDELLVDVPLAISDEKANALLTQAMLEPSEKYILKVPSKAEANPCAPYWKKF